MDSPVLTLRQLVDIPSPTGEEGALAKHICRRLDSFDLHGFEQVIDASQSNAMGQIAGSGGGVNLLLYAPIDAVTSASADEDLPWAGADLREDMLAQAYVKNGHVFGLGAYNPKGHAACIIEAARAIRRAGISLAGDLRLGFGAGGMPYQCTAGNSCSFRAWGRL